MQGPSLIAEHDTWISMDPVVGCPADCAYCYLGPMNLRAKKPTARVTPAELARSLRAYLYGQRAELIDPREDPTPLCLGNYTDMLMTRDNRRFLVDAVRALDEVVAPRPLVLITKAAVAPDLVAELDEFGWPIIWFFTQSFARDRGMDLERGRIADFETTLRNAMAVSTSRHQHAVHFWRPFVPELAPAQGSGPVVRRLRDSGMRCSVVTGMHVGPGVPMADPRLRALLPSVAAVDPDRIQVIDAAGWRETAAAGRNADYPVYRHSSCAIALVRASQEQLGTWRTDLLWNRCLPCSCPNSQRSNCRGLGTSGRKDAEDVAGFGERLAKFLGIAPEQVSWDASKGYLYIEANVSEFSYNTILHASRGRYVVSARSVAWQRAWRSRWYDRARAGSRSREESGRA